MRGALPVRPARRVPPMRSATLLLVLAAVVGPAVDAAGSPESPPESGEAYVRYLGHAGWEVRTKDHLLLFDYVPAGQGEATDGGRPWPSATRDRSVIVFISHSHGDHFDRRIFDLREAVPGITFVLGWKEPGVGEDVIVPVPGEWTVVAGARVQALHHDFDGIPEGFFLVRSGGLSLYHSGDHGTWSDPPDERFRANIDRLAREAGRIDLAFLSAFGKRGGDGALNAGDAYTLDILAPRVVFPMHCGGCEERYAAFEAEARKVAPGIRFGVAEAPGARFHYRDGGLR